MTPALEDELEAAAAKRVAVKQSSAALLPSLPLDSFDSETLACWALITGNLWPCTTGYATEGVEASFALSSDDPAPEMA